MKVSCRLFRVLVITMVFLFFVQEGEAQELSLSGTVRDADGVVPDATVTLLSGGSEPRATMTDTVGAYSFSGVAAGHYQISFAKQGYDTVNRNLTLGPDTGPVDVTFAVGAVAASITVTDVAG